MLKLPIYMDNHATPPLDPRVLEAMMPYLREDFGNAASRNHPFGWKAEAAVEQARKQVAALIGASEKELVFTSGATESDNLAIKGVVEFYKEKGDHIITLKTEHKAVLDTCKRLERIRQERLDELKLMRLAQLTGAPVSRDHLAELSIKHDLDNDTVYRQWAEMPTGGARVTYLDVEKDGRIDLKKLEAAMTDKTILVSISAHKMYGPKGVGALYVRRKPRVRIAPIIDGGGQERGMRSGTLNVSSIVGFGAAAQIAREELAEESARIFRLREKLRTGIMSQLDMLTINGSMEHRLPGNLNISFAYVEGEALMMSIKDVAVSSGSACTSASLEPSYVLRACGVEEDMAHSSIRFGIGRFNTEEEVDYVVRLVVDKVRKLRDMSPLYEMAKDGIDLKSIEWTAH